MNDPDAFQAFLAPLKRLAARNPGIEGQVLWAAEVEDGWQVQDDTADMLDAEEIPFYVEGLLVEADQLWLMVDNNEFPRVADKNDRRPQLWRCPRPDLSK